MLYSYGFEGVLTKTVTPSLCLKTGGSRTENRKDKAFSVFSIKTNTKELAGFIIAGCNEKEKMSDEDKARMDARILAKLKAGKKLTQKELDYLRATNPFLYAQAMRIQAMVKALEERLKHAKSKEEANDIIFGAMGGISKNDPAKEYIVAAISRVSDELHHSPAYSRLPATDEDVKKNREKKEEISFKDTKEDNNDTDNEETIDLTNWSPLQEIIDNLPKFSAGA